MSLPRLAALATGLLIATATHAQDAKAVEAAQAAASRWLATNDQGAYAQSWEQAAGLLKGAVTAAQWEQSLKAVRTPLGAVQSRQQRSAQYAKALPGAPDGHYVVIQFETRFEHKAQAIETVTPMLDKDGTWRVSGYFIR